MSENKQQVPITITKEDGTKERKSVNVQVLRMDKNNVRKVERALNAQSNLKDEDQKYYTTKNIIIPPYDPLELIELEEESNALRECIDAMVTNTVSFGYHFRPRKMDSDIKDSLTQDLQDEEIELDTFFDTICLQDDLLMLNEKQKKDHELTGNAYLEVLKVNDEIVELVHAPTHLMRLAKQDRDLTPYIIKKVIHKDGDFIIKSIPRRKRFRRFAQIDNSGKVVTWFKEYGDPRNINKNTGEVMDGEVDPTKLASEIIHNRIYSSRTPYGIPRWISRIVDIKGSRRAAEINYFTLSNNHVPTLFMMVENGTISDGSVERLQELIETQVGDDPNHGKIVIIESEGVENNFGISEATAGKLKIKNVKEAQHQDQLYQDYDQNSRKRIRSSFRLAPIHTGDTDDYSHASVKEARRVTDEQVFAPLRNAWSNWLNSIMVDNGFKYHLFKLNTPNITDNQILVSLIKEMNNTGALTPRRTTKLAEDIFEGELGPMPKGIDLDVPFPISFANAQNAVNVNESEDNEETESEGDIERHNFARQFVEEVLREQEKSNLKLVK